MKKILSGMATLLVLAGIGCSAQPSSPTQGANETGSASTSSSRIDMSGQGLTAFPKSVLSRTDLRELDISGNMLTGAMPAEIRMLVNLEVLDASDNAMTGLPAEIGQLRNLRVLDLSNNQLTGLPMELGNLSDLQTLDLRGNAYSKQDLDGIRQRIPKATILVDDRS